MDETHNQVRQTILIADDAELNRAILAEMLGEDYDVVEAENGAQAVQAIQGGSTPVDLLLLDINMPVMDGFQVLEQLGRERLLGNLPVVMISSENASSFVERAYDLGASDYISRPFDQRVVRRRVLNTLMLYAKQRKLARMVAEQVYEKERSNNLMINILSQIVEFRNGESGRHVLNIRVITELLLRQLHRHTDRYGLEQADEAAITTASALHDIGKISVSSEILNKPGRLTDEEFAIMKTHSAIGAEMLGKMAGTQDEPLMKAAYEICRWHHERWDGRGYPDGLRGDEIPISAQIVALADVYDALTSERCYKKAFSHETAIRMILDGECGAFNPLLLDCLRRAAPRLPDELKAGERDQTGERQAVSVVDRLLKLEDLGYSSRAAWDMELEREKARFFTAHVEELQFVYSASARTVNVSTWGAKRLGLRSTLIYLDGEEGEALLSDENIRRFYRDLCATTPEQPEVEREMLLALGGEMRWYRVLARALWICSGQTRFVGAVGICTDVHEKYMDKLGEQADFRNALGALEVTALMRDLRHVFDVVRLVDVEQAVEVDPETDCRALGRCYAIWGRAHRCSNCISSIVLEQKTQLTKFEFVGEEIHQVISRYLEVDGRPCVLEMVLRLRNDALRAAYNEQELIRRLSSYRNELYLDSLTGVYNRRYFDDHIETLDHFEAVVMIDVDDFKTINDTYGHHAGDLALRAIAGAMGECTRSSDILLRYGGDEFLLLYPNIPKVNFDRKMEQLQQAVREVRIDEFPEISLSISVGGAYGIHPASKAVELADERMYETKARWKQARSGEPSSQ